MIGSNEWVACLTESGGEFLVRADPAGKAVIPLRKNAGPVFLTKDLIGARYGTCFDLKLVADIEERTLAWKENPNIADRYLKSSKKRNRDDESADAEIHRLIETDGVGVLPNSEGELRESRKDLIDELKRIDELLGSKKGSYGDTDDVKIKTNEFLYDKQGQAQNLTAAHVKALKSSEMSAAEVARTIAESSTTFEGKTQFSQDKFLKRSTKKHSRCFRVVKANSQTICQALWMQKQGTGFRIGNMRPMDTIPQILSLSCSQPGSRALVIDSSFGVLLGSILERMGDEGKLYNGFFDSQNPEMMDYFNFSKDQLALHQNIDLNLLCKGLPADMKDQIWTRRIASLQNVVSDNEKVQKNIDRTLVNFPKPTGAALEAFDFLTNTGADSLVIASRYHPPAVFRALYPFLAPSRPFVVFSESIDDLEEIRVGLMRQPITAANTRLAESWFRQYQVLPGRSHPEMMTSSRGGFILSGTKIADDGVHLTHRKNVKKKTV